MAARAAPGGATEPPGGGGSGGVAYAAAAPAAEAAPLEEVFEHPLLGVQRDAAAAAPPLDEEVFEHPLLGILRETKGPNYKTQIRVSLAGRKRFGVYALATPRLAGWCLLVGAQPKAAPPAAE